jgi:hypothetical protein
MPAYHRNQRKRRIKQMMNILPELEGAYVVFNWDTDTATTIYTIMKVFHVPGETDAIAYILDVKDGSIGKARLLDLRIISASQKAADIKLVREEQATFERLSNSENPYL